MAAKSLRFEDDDNDEEQINLRLKGRDWKLVFDGKGPGWKRWLLLGASGTAMASVAWKLLSRLLEVLP